jgi:hypothetical protein
MPGWMPPPTRPSDAFTPEMQQRSVRGAGTLALSQQRGAEPCTVPGLT